MPAFQSFASHYLGRARLFHSFLFHQDSRGHSNIRPGPVHMGLHNCRVYSADGCLRHLCRPLSAGGHAPGDAVGLNREEKPASATGFDFFVRNGLLARINSVRFDCTAAAQRVGRALMKEMISIALVGFSVAILCSTPLAYGAGDGGVSPSEFQRYQSQQELELEREQALRADRSAPRSPEETRRQRRRFESERIWQRQLLERQRRRAAAERVRLRPTRRAGSSRGIVLQRLRREQASEQLRRQLLH